MASSLHDHAALASEQYNAASSEQDCASKEAVTNKCRAALLAKAQNSASVFSLDLRSAFRTRRSSATFLPKCPGPVLTAQPPTAVIARITASLTVLLSLRSLPQQVLALVFFRAVAAVVAAFSVLRLFSLGPASFPPSLPSASLPSSRVLSCGLRRSLYHLAVVVVLLMVPAQGFRGIAEEGQGLGRVESPSHRVLTDGTFQ